MHPLRRVRTGLPGYRDLSRRRRARRVEAFHRKERGILRLRVQQSRYSRAVTSLRDSVSTRPVMALSFFKAPDGLRVSALIALLDSTVPNKADRFGIDQGQGGRCAARGKKKIGRRA